MADVSERTREVGTGRGQSAGRDRQRKVQPCPESYCWSIDVAGPF